MCAAYLIEDTHPVVDPGFPRREGLSQRRGQPIILAILSQKCINLKKNSTRRGRTFLVPSLDPRDTCFWSMRSCPILLNMSTGVLCVTSKFSAKSARKENAGRRLWNERLGYRLPSVGFHLLKPKTENSHCLSCACALVRSVTCTCTFNPTYRERTAIRVRTDSKHLNFTPSLSILTIRSLKLIQKINLAFFSIDKWLNVGIKITWRQNSPDI